MRLGDLDALKEVITANHYLLSSRNNSIDYGMFTTGIIQAIDNAPTVEAYTPEQVKDLVDLNKKLSELRPRGKWVFMSGVTCGGYYKCNKCGEVERAEKNYCSNCGAYMKGSADNTPTIAINKDFYKEDKSNPINRSDLFQ